MRENQYVLGELSTVNKFLIFCVIAEVKVVTSLQELVFYLYPALYKDLAFYYCLAYHLVLKGIRRFTIFTLSRIHP